MISTELMLLWAIGFKIFLVSKITFWVTSVEGGGLGAY